MSKVRCAFCDDFVDKDGALSNGMQNFCGREHLVLYREKIRKKAKKTRTPFPPGLKDAVMELDGRRCRFCGGLRNLIVHHILYRSRGGGHTEMNLITLCGDPCHDTVHSNKRLYMPMCELIAGLRMEKGDKTTTISQLERDECKKS